MTRSFLAGLGLVTLVATPALAAHTQDAVIYDNATGVVRMIVVPSDDKELSDPAFNPAGATQVRIVHTAADPVASAKALAPTIQGPADVQAAVTASIVAVASASLATCAKSVACAASLSAATAAAALSTGVLAQ